MASVARARSRQPQGLSTGGQFAPETKAEPQGPGLSMQDLPLATLQANLPEATVVPAGTGYQVTLGQDATRVNIAPDQHIPDNWNATIEGYDAISSSTHPNMAVDLAVLSAKADDIVGNGLYNNVAVMRGKVVELVPTLQAKTRTETALELEVQDPNSEDGNDYHSLLVHPVSGLVLEVADAESGTRVEAWDQPEEYTVAALQAAEEIRDELARESHLSRRARQMVHLDDN